MFIFLSSFIFCRLKKENDWEEGCEGEGRSESIVLTIHRIERKVNFFTISEDSVADPGCLSRILILPIPDPKTATKDRGEK
jgi:hypothetical protein